MCSGLFFLLLNSRLLSLCPTHPTVIDISGVCPSGIDSLFKALHGRVVFTDPEGELYINFVQNLLLICFIMLVEEKADNTQKLQICFSPCEISVHL